MQKLDRHGWLLYVSSMKNQTIKIFKRVVLVLRCFGLSSIGNAYYNLEILKFPTNTPFTTKKNSWVKMYLQIQMCM